MNSNLLPLDSNFSPPKRGLTVALAALVVLLAFHPFVTMARAASPIEGVWSFNGGRIAIQEQQPGVFEGTVVAPTTFSLCTHPEGEQVWTQMVQQPGGSYLGNHQWFFETSECVRNPAPGPTAWRVLQTAEGRYLRVCFSEPGSNLQPTISPTGESSNATFGCVDSALVSALPGLSPRKASRYIHLPSNRACLTKRRMRILVAAPENDPIKRVVATARGRGVTVKAKLHDTKRGVFAILRLAKLPLGAKFTVKVGVTTLLGDHLTTRRTYHRCPSGSGR